MIQIDIPMPASCELCPFCNGGMSLMCGILKKSMFEYRLCRSPECPLKEVVNKTSVTCKDCGHDKNKTCSWDHLYGDVDDAFECCDFYWAE